MGRRLVVFICAGDTGDLVERELSRWATVAAEKCGKSSGVFDVALCSDADKATIRTVLAGDRDIWLVAFWCHGRRKDGALLRSKRRPMVDRTNCSLLASRRVYTICCHSQKLFHHVVCASGRPPASSFFGFRTTFDMVINRKSGTAYCGFEESCSIALDVMVAGRDARSGVRNFRKKARRHAGRSLATFVFQRLKREPVKAANNLLCVLAHAHNIWSVCHV